MSKLVRDKIPEIIQRQTSQSASVHTANDAEFWQSLQDKLLEECYEFIESEQPEELADIFEVLDAIIEYKGFQLDQIEKIQTSKAFERGQFKSRIILED